MQTSFIGIEYSFRLVHLKFLLTHEKCDYGKIVPKKSHLKFLVDLKASKLSQIGHFLFYCPFRACFFF